MKSKAHQARRKDRVSDRDIPVHPLLLKPRERAEVDRRVHLIVKAFEGRCCRVERHQCSAASVLVKFKEEKDDLVTKDDREVEEMVVEVVEQAVMFRARDLYIDLRTHHFFSKCKMA